MKYLSVGTNTLYKDLLINVTKGKNDKPRGGLWATPYKGSNYNDWVEYLINHISVLFYKYGYNPFNIPAVLLTLKSDSKIYVVNDKNNLDYIKTLYPDDNGWINYSALFQDFDGIMIDPRTSIYVDNFDDKQKLWAFNINSLILNNLDCIKYYEKASINIEPFDYEYENANSYEITIEHIKRYVNTFPYPELLTYIINNYKEKDSENIDNYLIEHNVLEQQTRSLIIRKAFIQS